MLKNSKSKKTIKDQIRGLLLFFKTIAYVLSSKNEPSSIPIKKNTQNNIKKDVQTHWNKNVCDYDESKNFDEIDQKRYLQYPYLFEELDIKNDVGKKILEIGIGVASDACKSLSEGNPKRYVLYDLSTQTTRIAKQHLTNHCNNEFFDIVNGDAENLCFQDETFDRVRAIGSLHHMPDSQKALKEIHRVLKKGGDFIFMFYNKDSIRYNVTFKYNTRKKQKNADDLVNEIDGKDNPLGVAFSKRQLLEMCNHANLICTSILFWELSDEEKKYLSFLANYFERRYGFSSYVHGKKEN